MSFMPRHAEATLDTSSVSRFAAERHNVHTLLFRKQTTGRLAVVVSAVVLRLVALSAHFLARFVDGGQSRVTSSALRVS
jgi:hypothetical protein